MGPRIGFLGPEGTFSHEALRDAPPPAGTEAIPIATLYRTVMAVEEGVVDLALLPIENALEGSVDVTLDTLASDAGAVTIVGESIQPIRNSLIAAGPMPIESITTVHSHPQPTGQCARFLRDRLPGATVVAASSTAEAVRVVATQNLPGEAAIGNHLAAEIYGAHVLIEHVDDEPDNVTRFVWLARSDRAAELRVLVEHGERSKTAIVFWGAGDEASGWLVACLSELSTRDVNLTRIESRPRRIGFGHYMFFADLAGSTSEAPVADAIDGLRKRCQEVRLLGSYRAP
ncbi:MAG TPA: prephenate dehydratase [Solirubrobacteraceae bacterium]